MVTVAVRHILQDRGARWVLAGWSLFTLENLVMSEYRAEIKRAWGGAGGPGAYQSFYSTLSALALGSTCYGYRLFADTGIKMAPATGRARAVAVALRAGGLVILGQLAPPINLGAAPIALGLSKPSSDLPPHVRGAMGCPFDFNAYKDRGEIYGITRVTRRPELVGLGAVALGGAFLATTPTQICFFGVGPMACFSILALHSDRTSRRAGELSAEKEEQTSLLPFFALLTGRQSWSALMEETVGSNAGAGVALALLAACRPSWMRWVK